MRIHLQMVGSSLACAGSAEDATAKAGHMTALPGHRRTGHADSSRRGSRPCCAGPPRWRAGPAAVSGPPSSCATEYQTCATIGEDDPAGDEKAFALTRQSRLILIVATQSISSLRAVFLEEILFHEAAHVSLHARHTNATAQPVPHECFAEGTGGVGPCRLQRRTRLDSPREAAVQAGLALLAESLVRSCRGSLPSFRAGMQGRPRVTPSESAGWNPTTDGETRRSLLYRVRLVRGHPDGDARRFGADGADNPRVVAEAPRARRSVELR